MSRIVFIGYAALVAFASLRPSSGLSLEPWDKLIHLVIYLVFALLGYRAVRSPAHYLVLCAGIVAYGGLMEIGQSFMPGRIMSLADLLANALGVLLGMIVARKTLAMAPKA